MTETTTHIAIVGGGIMGSMCALFLQHLGFAGNITIIERDTSYRYTATARSAASFRTQFACRFNVEMSVFGAEFLSNIQHWLEPETDIGLVQRGYLILHKHPLPDQHLTQLQQAGADIISFNPQTLQQQYPWLNPHGVAAATYGRTQEGWFDAWSLLQAVQAKVRARGARFLQAEAKSIRYNDAGQAQAVECVDKNAIKADWIINAAGPLAAEIHRASPIQLPVEPRKRTVFSIRSPLNEVQFPMLIDTSGVWIRPEGQGHICGVVPPAERDPPAHGDFQPDHELFEECVWPALAHRIPHLESLRMERAWAGHYEVNCLDHNGIVGPHSSSRNLLFATGFSGHGLQHAPAVGRAIAEHILLGRYQSLDLSPLSFDRILKREGIIENAVY